MQVAHVERSDRGVEPMRPCSALAWLLCCILGGGVLNVCEAVGISARNGIDLLGNPISTDSFNSANPTSSRQGLYDPLKASTNGDLFCWSGTASLGNACINGSLKLGTHAGYALGPAGSISGPVAHNVNLFFSDVTLPPTTWIPIVPSNVLIDGILYQFVFNGSGNYVVSGLNGSVYVGTNAQIRLLASGGNATFSTVRVAGSGSSAGRLQIYADVPTCTFSQQVQVDGGNAMSFTYYGTCNNSNLTFTKITNFAGAIFAPNALFLFNNPSPAIYDFVGSLVADSIRISGRLAFHFDENLLVFGPSPPTILLQPQSQSVLIDQNVTFSVSAIAQTAYQWQINGTNIADATNSLLSVAHAASADAGDYRVIVSNAFGSLESAPATLTVNDPNLMDSDGDGMPDSWELSHGFDPNDPGDAMADPDGDGSSNLMEYALGTDPGNPGDTNSGMVLSVLEVGGNHYLSIKYKQRIAVPPSLEYVVEVSSDNQNWFSDANHVQQVSVLSLDGQFNSVTVRDTTPLTAATPRYMRLSVRVSSTTTMTSANVVQVKHLTTRKALPGPTDRSTQRNIRE